MSNLSIYTEAARSNIFAPAALTVFYNLPAGVAQSIQTPPIIPGVNETRYTVCVFSATSNIYVNFLGEVASGATETNGLGDEINPTVRLLPPGTTFSVLSKTGGDVSVSYYVQE